MIPSPRFKIVETDGYELRTARGPLLSVSVLDSAYCYREVARFNQEDIRPLSLTEKQKREAIRNRAVGLAAILEADCA